MKNYTRKGFVNFGKAKRDYHPAKHLINWWEDVARYKSKTAKRMALKRELKKLLKNQ